MGPSEMGKSLFKNFRLFRETDLCKLLAIFREIVAVFYEIFHLFAYFPKLCKKFSKAERKFLRNLAFVRKSYLSLDMIKTTYCC